MKKRPSTSSAGHRASREDRVHEGRSAEEIRTSEVRYRRLFEAARDGILIVDPDTNQITDANPFMVELLDYGREELLGKELWQIGLLKDETANRNAFRKLREDYYLRYEDLPLRTKSGRSHEVEFVSNLYEEDGRNVIQCNRDYPVDAIGFGVDFGGCGYSRTHGKSSNFTADACNSPSEGHTDS